MEWLFGFISLQFFVIIIILLMGRNSPNEDENTKTEIMQKLNKTIRDIKKTIP